MESVREITEMEVEEVFLVDVPANKHCRTLTLTYNGKNIDLLTLRAVAEITKDSNSELCVTVL